MLFLQGFYLTAAVDVGPGDAAVKGLLKDQQLLPVLKC